MAGSVQPRDECIWTSANVDQASRELATCALLVGTECPEGIGVVLGLVEGGVVGDEDFNGDDLRAGFGEFEDHGLELEGELGEECERGVILLALLFNQI